MIDTMSSPLLDVRNLSVSFRTEKLPLNVVSGLSFDVQPGEVVGVVGESGCGKSLTALSILGILPANAHAQGVISYKGRDLLTMDEDALRGIRGKEISIIFQEPMTSLNPVLTVGYQIAEALLAHQPISKREAMERAVSLMRSVRIPSPEMRVRDYPHQLSGGMRQRVMIAMAIACGPSLLIADEPTTALDVTIQAQILELLRGLRSERGMALLLITHDLSIISEQADRVAIMYAGRFMEVAPSGDLFLNPLHPYTRGLLKSVATVKGVEVTPIRGYVPSPDSLPEGCTFSDRCDAAAPRCHEREPELEEAAPHHMVRCVRWHEL
jgi:oligopeptide/dipeptide ABC transporter ATP-binding protein